MNRMRHLGPLAAALVLPLAACGGGSSSGGGSSAAMSVSPSSTSSSSTSTSASPSSSASASPSVKSSSSASASGTATGKKGSGGSAQGSQDAKGSTSVPKTSAVHISVPSIGLDHAIVGGGLNGGVLSPPPGQIIQFTGYNRVIPGQPGIAVLAGHVTYNGPDVFYSLHNLSVGSPLTITYGDGSTKKFVVSNAASVNKDALQNDSRVWGSSSTPVVALVTCDAGSAWVNAEHHANNYVVWARPA